MQGDPVKYSDFGAGRLSFSNFPWVSVPSGGPRIRYYPVWRDGLWNIGSDDPLVIACCIAASIKKGTVLYEVIG